MQMIKRIGKRLLCRTLESQVRRLRAKHQFAVVAVAGSVGKTSTKISIATILGKKYLVRHQEGNYNDRLTVPLVIFGHTNPALFNVFAWINILINNERQISRTFDYDVVVVELGTDAPGQIAEFAYLQPEIAVVTAATAEHMEFFGTLDAVAREELSVARFSQKTIINTDDVPETAVREIQEYISYGLEEQADYVAHRSQTTQGIPQKIKIRTPKDTHVAAELNLLGTQGIKIALGAFVAAVELGMKPKEAADALADLQAFSGRMRLLDGKNGTTIIDDTYNASPAAVFAALDVLYGIEAPQKIAILGNMNELGDTSKESHIAMGEYCDPSQLDYVITIGSDANTYASVAAKKRGCKVKTFDSPYKAGVFAAKILKPGAVLLAKGSQNRVFAEESLKSVLSDEADQQKLVRQSPYWLKIKHEQFLEGQE